MEHIATVLCATKKLSWEIMIDDKCCGTCKYHHHENIDDGWVCVNDRSEYCADWTEYEDFCEEYEER